MIDFIRRKDEVFSQNDYLYYMKFSGIYKIQSKIKPDRYYIGSAMDIRDRWWHHKSNLKCNRHINTKLQNHYNKYGKNDLIYSIIEPCLPEFLTIREQLYLYPLPWFNISKIAGNPMKGRKHTAEWKKEMSIRNSGINNPSYGKFRSLKSRKLMSELKKGNKHSSETKLKMSGKIPWNKGKTGIYSEERRMQISLTNSRRIPSQETREKQRKATTGRILSQEIRDKIGSKVREAARIRRTKLIA